MSRSDPLHRLHVEGLGWWTPAWPDWVSARDALAGRCELAEAAAPLRRPAAALLAANERRRAPESVLIAIEAAQAAVAMAGRDAADLASVFSSTHGDLAIVEAVCTTLAADPLLLSPTRFHHSVHNAAAGYWAIATGCRRSSTSIAHFGQAFATGLLEAASQCLADREPVLLVAFDTEAVGALTAVNASRGRLGVALVLAPGASPRSRWHIDWALRAGPATPTPLVSSAARSLANNAMADALPLFEALASDRPAGLALPLGPELALSLQLAPS